MDLPRLPRSSRRAADARVRRPSAAPVALPAMLDHLSERWWRLSPRLRMVVLVALGVVVLALVGRGATTSPWGPPRQVLVLQADLPAGAPVGPDDVELAEWPTGLVPADALADLPDDARVRGPAAADAVLTGRHLVSGLAGLLQAGEAAVSVPLDGLPAVAADDVVDVVTATPDGAGHRAATAARVLAVDAAFLWLAVDREQVDTVAAAGAAGRVTLAVRAVPAPD